MALMAKKKNLIPLYVRTPVQGRSILRRLLLDVQDVPGFGDLLQEELVSASWLWMAKMDPAKLAKELGPHIVMVRAMAELETTQPIETELPTEDPDKKRKKRQG